MRIDAPTLPSERLEERSPATGDTKGSDIAPIRRAGVFRRWVGELTRQVPPTGLSIVRICTAACLMANLAGIAPFRHLIFDPIPYLVLTDRPINLLIGLWFVAIVLLGLGLFTRLAAVVNYALIVYFTSNMQLLQFEYHADHMLTFLSAAFIVAPVSRNLALDPLLRRVWRPRPPHQQRDAGTVNHLWYLLLAFAGIGFVYLDSVFYKAASPFWVAGLGMWLPAAMLPMSSWFDLSPILNVEWLVRPLGFLTFAYEVLFVPLMWFRPTRLVLLAVGLGLHLGIGVAYPIPVFGLAGVTALLLLVPPEWWGKVGARIRRPTPRVTVYFDEDCGLCNRTRTVFEHFDPRGNVRWLGAQSFAPTEAALAEVDPEQLLVDIHAVDRDGTVLRGFDAYVRMFRHVWIFRPVGLACRLGIVRVIGRRIYRRIADSRSTGSCALPKNPGGRKVAPLARARRRAGIVLACAAMAVLLALQATMTIVYAVPGKLGRPLVDPETTQYVTQHVRPPAEKYLGITPHAVFHWTHFAGYDHMVSLSVLREDGTEEMLPIVTEDGKPGRLNFERLWVYWTHRVVRPATDTARLRDATRRYTAFWNHHAGIGFEDAHYVVMVKPFGGASEWRDNELERSRDVPWTPVGTADWVDGEFRFEVADIESITVPPIPG